MKHVKKIFAFALTLVMAFAVALPAFAQTAAKNPADADHATITIKNAAKGETYTIYKLFDATLTDVPESGESDGIAYTGTIPESLKTYFTKDEAGNIHLTTAGGTANAMSADLKDALEEWAETADVYNYAVSDGSELSFTDLAFGYYVVTTSQGEQAITVDSTNPNATIVDKNSSSPSAVKTTEDNSYSVGDTVTYTATFDAPNYLGDPVNDEAQQIVSYTIKDTLPNFLSNVGIDSVTVKEPTATAGTTSDTVLDGSWAFDANGKITVPWATKGTDGKYTNKYKAGSKIVVVYHATVNANATVGDDNKNEVELIPNVDNGNGEEPYSTTEQWKDDEVITTHAAALQKKDDENNNLAGAEFAFQGLTVVGEPGMYTVVSYDPDSTDNGTVMKCDANGKLVIGGLDKGITLVGTETKAPDGYNKLAGKFELPTIEMAKTTTTTWGSKTTYYDADGNEVDQQVDGGSSTSQTIYQTISDIPETSITIVTNNKGVEMPSTGGIGTTIFYIVGGVMVAGAAIFLLTKRRMAAE